MLVIQGTSYWDDTRLVRGLEGFLIEWVFPFVITYVFWRTAQATPGKMAIGAKIVDARTGNKPSVGQCLGRYVGYVVALVPLAGGIIWVAFDSRKQGWHDKLAGTVVVRYRRRVEAVTFRGA